MRVFTLCSIVTVLLLSTLPSYSADPQHGLILAKRWCATCHVVSADQQRASTDVPPFATIAVISAGVQLVGIISREDVMRALKETTQGLQ